MDETTNNNQNTVDNQPATTPAVPTPAPSHVKIVGVRFKRAGRIYYFDPKDFEFNPNDYVIVETARGLEIGRVVLASKQVLVSEIEMPLKAVIRKAEPTEAQHSEETEKKEREALVECGKMVARLGLPMKLLSAEYSLDGNHITFFFSAAERVDFRELVRELATRFRVRVELRQVGARDETKIMGGYGRCGRPLCCVTWLSEFQPISIKMAKEQGLPLNPMKISGVCGRLLCCLSYEHLLYRDMRGKMPREGQPVTTPMGPARVVGNNPLKETVVVELETQVTVELPLEDIKIVGPPITNNMETVNNNKEVAELKENGITGEEKGKP
ncbi:MAG: stage 0 sporulation family protein [Dehalococcoidales bacterium]|nr:stage 0 sporulation family protein [Dehalococcoidales bacterium]